MKKIVIIVGLTVVFVVTYALAGVGYKDDALRREFTKNLYEVGAYTDEQIVEILKLKQFGEDMDWEKWQIGSGDRILIDPNGTRAAIVFVDGGCVKLVKLLYDRSEKEK